MKKNNDCPAWNLTDLYASPDDKKLAADLDFIAKSNAAFAKKYKGKMTKLEPSEFAAMLEMLEKIKVVSHNLGNFAYLYMVTQMKNEKAVAFYQSVCEKLTDYSKPVVFFSVELNQISEAQFKKLLADKKVAKFKPFLTRVRRFKHFELSEKEELVFHEKALTSSDAWVRLYEETSSRLSYCLNGKTYNDAEISKMTLDKDPEIRHAAGAETNRVLKENSYLFTYIYNMILKDKAVEDDKRGFKTPVSPRNLSENVADKTVEVLTQTVVENYQNLAHRFYKLKAKWLGLKKMSYWDRNAPLPFCNDKKYSWNEAVATVLAAYKSFSPKLYDLAKPFFDHNWVDVPPRDGKRSGAFCAGGAANAHPYLLLNFMGTQNDVLTLAHELGHGCHHQTRTQNGELNEHSRMTSEEVASVFGEMITFQYILQNTADKKARLCLIASKVNDMLNTAVRQIAFHCFETRCHAERKNGELSTARLNEIWLEEMQKSLGKYVDMSHDCDYIWSMVGHFFFLPFYVYSYSFADCLVNSLYQVKTEGKIKNFAELYLNMLSQTAIGEYKDIFKPFKLDPDKKDFWQKGLNLIASYIDELEKLDKELKA